MTSGLLPGYKTIIRDAKLFSKVWVEITSILIKPKQGAKSKMASEIIY